MPNWVKEYQSKLVSAHKAVSSVKNGDWIQYSFAATPCLFLTLPWPNVYLTFMTL